MQALRVGSLRSLLKPLPPRVHLSPSRAFTPASRMSAPKPLIVEPTGPHKSTVIVAHGLGDSGAGWAFLAQEWRARSLFPTTKFIFPSAPSIPITINMNMTMPGWYDITSFAETAPSARVEDETGILRSQAYFHSLIADEIRAGVPTERIVIGGFSQGGAMALIAGITCPTKLGGIFGLSSYLLLEGKVQGMVPKENPNKETPIFMGHGDADPIVRYAWGTTTAERLKAWGWKVDFRTYPGLVHSAAPREINDLEAYVRERLPEA